MEDDGRRVIDAAHRFRPPSEPDGSTDAALSRIERMCEQLLAGTSPDAVVSPPTVGAAVTSTRPGVVPRSGVDARGSALPVVLGAVAGGVLAWSVLGGRR